MIKKNEENINEKKLGYILCMLFLFIVIILLKGIFNEQNKINQDNILVPSLLISCFTFCILYSFNAFTSGNLVRNWSSALIYKIIFNRIKKKNVLPDKYAHKKTIYYFGYFSLALALISIMYFIYFLNT